MTTPATIDLNTLMATFRTEFERDQGFWNSSQGQKISTSPIAYLEFSRSSGASSKPLVELADKMRAWQISQLDEGKEPPLPIAPSRLFVHDAWLSKTATICEEVSAGGGPKFFARKVSKATMDVMSKIAKACESGVELTPELGWEFDSLLTFGDSTAAQVARKILVAGHHDLLIKPQDGPNLNISSAFLLHGSDIFPPSMKKVLRQDSSEPLEIPCTDRGIRLVERLWAGDSLQALLSSGFIEGPDQLKEGVTAADALCCDFFPQKSDMAEVIKRFLILSNDWCKLNEEEGLEICPAQQHSPAGPFSEMERVRRAFPWFAAIDVPLVLVAPCEKHRKKGLSVEKSPFLTMLTREDDFPFPFVKIGGPGSVPVPLIVEHLKARKLAFGLILDPRTANGNSWLEQFICRYEIPESLAEIKSITSLEICSNPAVGSPKCLLELIKKNPPWPALSLSMPPLGDRFLQKLCEAVKSCPNLKSLSLMEGVAINEEFWLQELAKARSDLSIHQMRRRKVSIEQRLTGIPAIDDLFIESIINPPVHPQSFCPPGSGKITVLKKDASTLPGICLEPLHGPGEIFW